jgi:hypothetical protein
VAKGIESPLQLGETINDQEVKLAYGCAAPSRFVGIDQHSRWKDLDECDADASFID